MWARRLSHISRAFTTRISVASDSLLIRAMSSNTRPKVYVTRRVPQTGVDILRERCEVEQWAQDDPVPRDELLKKVKGVDGLFCLLTDKIDDELLDAAGPQLKAIGTMSVGFDHVDIAACTKRGIPVGHTPAVLTDATAELTVALLLATSRRLIEGVNAVKSGEWGTWAPLWLLGSGLTNSTVGIAGLGRIGYAVAKRLQPFGVTRFLYSDSCEKTYAKDFGAEFVSLDKLYAESDFVLACVSLNPETTGMFNMSAFKKMKKTCIFINASRGSVVNQDDLYNALASGVIKAAGLDVTVPEPLPPTDKLVSLPNCVILPHIASATEDTRNEMSTLTANNILAVFDGKKMPAQVVLS